MTSLYGPATFYGQLRHLRRAMLSALNAIRRGYRRGRAKKEAT